MTSNTLSALKRHLWQMGLICGLAMSALAQSPSPEAQYVDIYQLIAEADRLFEQEAYSDALIKYREAGNELRQLRTGNPDWNKSVIEFRLDYVKQKLAQIEQRVTRERQGAGETSSALESASLAELKKRVKELTKQKQVLEAKLKEALSAQPARVDPDALAKAEKQIESLHQENERIKERLKKARQRLEEVESQPEENRKEQRLKETEAQIEKQQERLEALRKENATLKQQLKKLRVAGPPNETTASGDEQDRIQLNYSEELKRVRDALVASKQAIKAKEKELAKVTREKEQLEAQVAALQKKNAALRREKTRLKEQVVHLQKQLEKQGDVAALKAQLRKLKQALASHQAKTSSAAGKVNAVEGSPIATSPPDQGEAQTQPTDATAAASPSTADTGSEPPPTTTTPPNANASTSGTNTQKETKQKGWLGGLVAKIPFVGGGNNNEKEASPKGSEGPDAAASGKSKPQSEGTETAEGPSQQTNLEDQTEADNTPDKAKPKKRGWFGTVISKIPFVGGGKETSSKKSPDSSTTRTSKPESSEQPPKTAKTDDPSGADAAAGPPSNPADSSDSPEDPTAANEATSSQSSESTVGTIQSVPPGSGPLVAQAERAFARGDFQEAETKYQEVLRMDESNVFILSELAATQIEQGKLEAAQKHLQKALEKSPSDAFSLTLMGIIQFQQENYQEALARLNKAVAQRPNDAQAQKIRGITLSELGRRKEAESALRKAIESRPSFASAHYHLAIVYAAKEPAYPQLAQYHYAKAVNLGHPPNKELKKYLQALLESAGQAPESTTSPPEEAIKTPKPAVPTPESQSSE